MSLEENENHVSLSKSGRSLSGKARMDRLSPEERTALGKKAADSRWRNMSKDGKPVTAQYGAPDRPLKIGDIEIPCYVLPDGTRLLAQRGLQRGIGISEGGGHQGVRRIAAFMSKLEEKGIDIKNLTARSNSPIRFIPPHGGNPADGYEATILPDICAVIIDADQKGKLDNRLKRLAERAAFLQHGFATIGIIALVDEATGYQSFRDSEALQSILDRFIGSELAKWAKRFPDEYYRQLSRLRGLRYDPASSRRPMVLAQMTIDLVYDRIGPGLTKELQQRRQEVLQSTGKRGRLQQLLTEEVGHPALQHHLSGITFAARGFRDGDWAGFKNFMDRVSPPYNRTLLIPFPDQDPQDPTT